MLLILSFILLNTYCVYAEDTVTLETTEVFSLNIDRSKQTIPTINQYGEIVTEDDYNYSSKEDIEDEIFESKTGKLFNKFIDEKIIDNKINNFSTKMINKL